MKKMILALLLLALTTQSQFARADTDEILNAIKDLIDRPNSSNDLLGRLNDIKNILTNENNDGAPTNTYTTPPANATNAAALVNAAKNSTPATVGSRTTNIQNGTKVLDANGNVVGNIATVRANITGEMNKTALQDTGMDANGNTISVPYGGLKFTDATCDGAINADKKCKEDESHLKGLKPEEWKQINADKQIAQKALRKQVQDHKESLTNCKFEYEKLAANINPNTFSCTAAGVDVLGNPADAAAVAIFKSKAQAKYTNYTNSIANKNEHLDRVNSKNGELILAQHQQRIIRLVLAERADTDKSCNILDTKDLSILEPAAPVTPATVTATNTALSPLITSALITPLVSASGTYSNKYCSCIRLDAGGHCTEGKAVNFASKKMNAEMSALDCQIDTLTNTCKTTPIFMGNDSNGNPVHVNAIVKMTAEEKKAAIAAMTPAEKSAYFKKTRSVAFY